MLREKQIRRYFTAMPVLLTDRLILRRMKPCDAYDMYEYASIPEVSRYLPWSPHRDVGFTTEYLEFLEEKYAEGDFFDWALIWRADGTKNQKMIGTCGFTTIDYRNNSAEIGYVINPAYSGIGIATEAAKRILQVGFEELEFNRIQARYIIGNDMSRHVMDKIGMRMEGVCRGAMLKDGVYHDVGVCSILDGEYRRLRLNKLI